MNGLTSSAMRTEYKELDLQLISGSGPLLAGQTGG